MVAEVAIGIEISEDRNRTSVATAGYFTGDIVLMDLPGYIEGTDVLPAVQAIRADVGRTVIAVCVDPHSPGATAIEPLQQAGVDVTELGSTDCGVAFGEWLDLLRAGRLQHTGRPELTAAVRYATSRPLGGAQTWQRRGATVDMGPLTAGTWAVWGLRHVKPELRPEPWVAWGSDGPRSPGPAPSEVVMGSAPGMTPRGQLPLPPMPRGLPNVRRDN